MSVSSDVAVDVNLVAGVLRPIAAAQWRFRPGPDARQSKTTMSVRLRPSGLIDENRNFRCPHPAWRPLQCCAFSVAAAAAHDLQSFPLRFHI